MFLKVFDFQDINNCYKMVSLHAKYVNKSRNLSLLPVLEKDDSIKIAVK